MTTMEDRFAVNQIGPSPPSPIGASDAVRDPDWNVDAVGDPEGNADGDGVDGDIEYVRDADGGPVTRRPDAVRSANPGIPASSRTQLRNQSGEVERRWRCRSSTRKDIPDKQGGHDGVW